MEIKKKGTYKTVNNDKAQWRTGRRVFFRVQMVLDGDYMDVYGWVYER